MPARARNDADSPGVVAPPPLLQFGPLAVALALGWLVPQVAFAGPWRWAFLAISVAGFALAGGAVYFQRRAGTEVLPTRPTSRIVSTGPYAWTRNPIYLGNAVVHLGVALATGSVWALLSVPVGMTLVHLGAIRQEERYLTRKFGDEYLAYKARVRRWI